MQKNRKRPSSKRPSARSSLEMRPLGGEDALVAQVDLARLGDGQVAYIKTLTSAEARRMFPTIKGLPRGIDLYALHAADGTPIALTDSRQAAVGHAIEGELEIASVH
ncbi:MAG: DUF1150 domain-containing protein [Hyphomicrobiaceae bacterium]|nr:DUF1150 domain-containing protein [Hyphomicrobiaceae bacterium]